MRVRLFVEVDVNDRRPRRVVEEEMRGWIKGALSEHDRVVARQVVYIPEMLPEQE